MHRYVCSVLSIIYSFMYMRFNFVILCYYIESLTLDITIYYPVHLNKQSQN